MIRVYDGEEERDLEDLNSLSPLETVHLFQHTMIWRDLVEEERQRLAASYNQKLARLADAAARLYDKMSHDLGEEKAITILANTNLAIHLDKCDPNRSSS